MGFEPWTIGIQSQGLATELQLIPDNFDAFLSIKGTPDLKSGDSSLRGFGNFDPILMKFAPNDPCGH